MNPLLTPRDWQMTAHAEAAKMVGTTDYAAKMVEVRRYAMMADAMEALQAEVVQFRKTQALFDDVTTIVNQRDAALARLAALEKQEPYCYVAPERDGTFHHEHSSLTAYRSQPAGWKPLYAAVGASPVEPSQSLLNALSEAADAGMKFGAWDAPINAAAWRDVKGRLINRILIGLGITVTMFGCSEEAKGQKLCSVWCGSNTCPKSIILSSKAVSKESPPQPSQAREPVGINGLTEAETSASASVMGLTKKPAVADMESMLLGFDALLAKYHAAVWEAAADEDNPTDYDMAGVDVAKEIQAHVRKMLAVQTPGASGTRQHTNGGQARGIAPALCGLCYKDGECRRRMALCNVNPGEFGRAASCDTEGGAL
jgi:hypothetical protein